MNTKIDFNKRVIMVIDGNEYYTESPTFCNDYVNIVRYKSSMVSFWNFTYYEFNALVEGKEIEVSSVNLFSSNLVVSNVSIYLKNVRRNYALK